MNIFVTNLSPYESAIALDDKRLNKMILETCQILSTAVNENGGETQYKSTHVYHPVVKWCMSNCENYRWLGDYFHFSLEEYYKRFKKDHKCKRYFWNLVENIKVIPVKETRDDFVNCARNKKLNLDFTQENVVCWAYQKYLNARWATDKRKPKWTDRNPPHWANFTWKGEEK